MKIDPTPGGIAEMAERIVNAAGFDVRIRVGNFLAAGHDALVESGIVVTESVLLDGLAGGPTLALVPIRRTDGVLEIHVCREKASGKIRTAARAEDPREAVGYALRWLAERQIRAAIATDRADDSFLDGVLP